jgi:hypothetical protein
VLPASALARAGMACLHSTKLGATSQLRLSYRFSSQDGRGVLSVSQRLSYEAFGGGHAAGRDSVCNTQPHGDNGSVLPAL